MKESKIMSKVRRIGEEAEKSAMRKIGKARRTNAPAWDIIANGRKYEVKEAKYRIIHHGYKDYGRFRIRKEAHRDLMNANGIYIFVLRMGRGRRKEYYTIPAAVLEKKLWLLSRDKYGTTAGISTRWVRQNCKRLKVRK